MGKIDFINLYKQFFSKNNELKLRFEMGGKLKSKKRITQVLKRFEEISSYIFDNKEVWILLIIWDSKGNNKKELLNSGFEKSLSLADEYYTGKLRDEVIDIHNFNIEAFEDAEILYIKYKIYNFNAIFPIVYSKAGFELGANNTAGIVAYFISFSDEQPILLNLYDDRGMELLTTKQTLVNLIHNKFDEYIIK